VRDQHSLYWRKLQLVTQPEGMMLTGISLAVLGLYVGLSAGFEAYEVDYKGKKISMVPAWKGNKEWGGAQNKAQKERQVMPGVWRVESPMSSWEIADWVCRTQSNQKGRLIKINSKERYNELVKELYKLSTDWPYWTGLNDRQEEGKYKWQLCEDGKGEDLTAEMNLPFDNPNSHWEWMNPSKVNNPWGEEEDCCYLANWGDYTNIKATDDRPVDPSDPSKQFRFNDAKCGAKWDHPRSDKPDWKYAMPLCELVRECECLEGEEKEKCEETRVPYGL